MKSLVITTPGNIRLTIYPVGTVTVQQCATTCTIEIYNPGGKLLYECKETAEEVNAMLAASTANPTEADIAERVRLLRKTADLDAHPDKVSALGAQHYAAFDARFFLMYWTEEEFKTPYWCEVDEPTFNRELERVAIRQLLAERGGK
jgi:hypothetical protein